MTSKEKAEQMLNKEKWYEEVTVIDKDKFKEIIRNHKYPNNRIITIKKIKESI